MATNININVNPADENDFNQKKAQNHFDSLINDKAFDDDLEAFLTSKAQAIVKELEYAEDIQKQLEMMEAKAEAKAVEVQKQMDKLLDTNDDGDLVDVMPVLDPETKNRASQGKGSSVPGSEDVVLAQRIENLNRTIGSKSFRNQSVQLDPFFENLRDKSSKQTSQEDLDRLIQTEVDKQLANINDVETSLFNSIDLMNAQLEAKIQNIEAKLSKENADPGSDPRLQEYQQFQNRLSSLREDVSGYISESVDKIKDSAKDYARAGYDEGETARIIADADKEQKRVEKLVSSFNKDFDKYIDQQKKEIAKDYAFNTAQAYLDTTKGAKMDVAKKIYANAYQDFIDNAPVQSHGLSDEEIAALHAATGGNINPANINTTPVAPPVAPNAANPPNVNNPNGTVTPPPIQPPSGSRKGSSLPPGGQGLGNYNNYQGPPNNNSSSLTNPNQSGGSGTQSKIGVHMLLSEVTQAVIDPLMALASIPTELASAHLMHLSWASTKERIQTPDLIRSMGKTTQKNTEAITQATGATVGAVAGSAVPGIGTLAGAYVGGELGELAGNLIPIETVSNMVGYLYEIANNTSKQAEPFSSDLIQSNIDNQLAFLEENVRIGREMGSELAELNDATTDLQLTFYKEAIELVRPLLPAMANILDTIKQGIQLVGGISDSLTAIVNSIPGAMGFLSGILGIGRGRNKRPRGNQNQMGQLEDNVPFLP